jgi:glycosyltransferase involved in cell wall biosynthesis
LISVLLATYNWPEALSLSLQSLQQQSDKDFEIIICDDGSTSETKELIHQFQKTAHINITHLWQKDDGFKKSAILNQGIQAAQGDYLIFLDGDCIVQKTFIAHHKKLAEKNYMVTGSRILCNQNFTDAVCKKGIWSEDFFSQDLMTHFFKKHINKVLPLIIQLPDHPWRKYSKFVWRRIKGCNMACWKEDALAIGGFDEALVGWGHEDADFVFRLYNQGIQRKSGAWSTEVLHLWHKMADKQSAAKNAEIVRAKILAKINHS